VTLFENAERPLTRRPVSVSLVNKGVNVVQEPQTGLASGLSGNGRQGVSVEFLTDAACERSKGGSWFSSGFKVRSHWHSTYRSRCGSCKRC
jgi:hypothetical protein